MSDHLNEAQIAEFHEVFFEFASHSSKTTKTGEKEIETKHLGKMMMTLGFFPTEVELQNMISEIDIDRNGTVNFPEFFIMMSRWTEANQKDDDIENAFKFFDKDGDGSLTTAEMRYVMNNIGEKVSEEELGAILKYADKDGDGQINYDEFFEYFKI